MDTQNKYLFDTQPIKSAYKVPKKEMFNVLKSLYNDIKNEQNKFINNNKCWIYAFNFALIRRFKAENPRLKRKDIEQFEQNNADFLNKVETITHELKK